MLTHEYTLICEHARVEASGKWIIIGLYNDTIGTPMIPFPLPMLTFFTMLKSDSAGQTLKFNAKLTELVSGSVLANAQGGGMQPLPLGPVAIPLALANLQFKAFGTYIWSLEVEGEPEPFITQFNVMHVQPQMRIAPPPQRR